MLSKEDMETIIKVLDTDGLGCMITLIDNMMANAYNDGYDNGWNDCYDYDNCIEDDEYDEDY